METAPDKVVDDTKQMLDDLRDQGVTISPWLLDLVTQRQTENPQLTRYRAFREVMEEARQALAVDWPEDADLLLGRYWEGLTIQQMVALKRPRGVQERTLFEYQKKAIPRFTNVLWERVQASNQTSNQSTEPITTPEENNTVPRWFTPYRLIGVSIAIVFILAITLPLFRSQLTTQPCQLQRFVADRNSGTFLRDYGVINFTVENTEGGLLHNSIRALTIDRRGVWLGYFPGVQSLPASLGSYNGQRWVQCHQEEETVGKSINAMAVDQNGAIWIATEQAGVARLQGEDYTEYTMQDGLPENKTYGIVVDKEGIVWVATWAGIARFDGEHWSVPYSKDTNTLVNNNVHALAFDNVGNFWVGYIDGGVSQYDKEKQTWTHYTRQSSGLGGNKIRNIVIQQSTNTSPESIWIATADGGVSKFENKKWTVYNTSNGLPSDDVPVLTADKYGRVWAGTSKGTSYFDGVAWNPYHNLNTLSIAFGPACEDCPFDDEHIWTGTAGLGVTHSRIPYPTPVIEIVKVTYPQVVAPGTTLCPEVAVKPLEPYKLNQNDFLSYMEANDANLFGAHPIIPVTRPVQSNELYTFHNCDQPFHAPQLNEGEQERVLTSQWRVWMSTRYVGPVITIKFTVKRQ